MNQPTASNTPTATPVVASATGEETSAHQLGHPVLDVVGCSVRYGGVYANTDVDLSVHKGQLVGLIGPNGAGKSTCIDAISGFVALDSGSVRLLDERVDGLSAPDRARRGLSRTFQSLDLFEDLSVADNLSVATTASPWRSLFTDALRPLRRQRADPGVYETLERCGISDLADRRPSELSHGQRNLVALSRALAGNPEVVLLDEPAAGLDSQESETLGHLLASLADDGLGILLVDHDMSLVMRVCHRLSVLDFGRVISTGTPDKVRADDAVREAYLGAPGD